jgi:molybdopterin/thiamine biosynthesis adenylyltransferase
VVSGGKEESVGRSDRTDRSGKSRSPKARAGRRDLSGFATELYERNWAFLSPRAQTRLDETWLFAAGVGLASNIVTLACRTGFRRFILADGDRVELSNLNRQDFTLKQVGKNKAKAIARRLRRIRPDAEIRVLPYRLDESSYLEPLSHADIVINSIDFDERVLFLLNDAAQDAGKPVIQPLNLGWGGAVATFLPSSPRLAEWLGVSPSSGDLSAVTPNLYRRLAESLSDRLPTYLRDLAGSYLAQPEVSWAVTEAPQLGIGATITSALAVRAAVALALGELVRAVPDLVYMDLKALVEPAPRDLAPSTPVLTQHPDPADPVVPIPARRRSRKRPESAADG